MVGRAKGERGFTVVELLVVFVVVGVLAGISTWKIQTTLPAYRASGAAAQFLGAARSASAIAARTNRPVRLVVAADGACANAFSLQGLDGERYETTCIDSEFRGVILQSGGPSVGCAEEASLGMDPLPSCSLCGGGAITFLPNGEVQMPSAAGESLVFAPRDGHASAARAVGIRAGVGRAKVYRLEGAEWHCP